VRLLCVEQGSQVQEFVAEAICEHLQRKEKLNRRAQRRFKMRVSAHGDTSSSSPGNADPCRTSIRRCRGLQ